MKTAHTPSPWIIRKGDEWTHDVVTQHGDSPDGSPNYWNVAPANGRRDEVDANVRLIAAAPDLLEALCISKQFMEIASDWNIDEAEINGDMRSTYDWLEIVNAAIAKATTQ